MKLRAPIVALAIIFVLQLIDVGVRFAAGGLPWLGLVILALTAAAIGWLVLRKTS